MLDVHPPHSATHTWRDFLIHVGTICIGLLMAVGLEQTVEYFHHRHQVTETRKALQRERRQNIAFFGLERDQLREQAIAYRADLTVLMYLRSHPGVPASSWPGRLDWRWHGAFYPEANWITARLDGVVEHMPAAEVQEYDDIYTRLTNLFSRERDEQHAVEEVRRILFVYPDPSKATPAALDEAIKDMSLVLEAHSSLNLNQQQLARRHADFGPCTPPTEMDALLGIAGYPIQGDETPALDKRVNAILNAQE